jgi:radical SAM superfamily enzyme YgiQ (UPF0313 family)
VKIGLIQAQNKNDPCGFSPLWPGYLKSFAGQFWDDIEWMWLERLEDVWKFGPDILGVSSFSQDWDRALEIIRAANLAGIRHIVVGGQHVTSFPETCPDTAAAILGPGEKQFSDLIAYVRQDGRRIPAINCLDDIPIPDRKLGHKKGQKAPLMTSRGCPYRCSFCTSARYWGKVYMHSAGRVAGEIEQYFNDFPFTKILNIWDDLFAVDKGHCDHTRLLCGPSWSLKICVLICGA